MLRAEQDLAPQWVLNGTEWAQVLAFVSDLRLEYATEQATNSRMQLWESQLTVYSWSPWCLATLWC